MGVALTALSASANASTQSEILRSKGVLELLERNYDGAVAILRQAAESDADDHLSHYYYAVALSRDSQYELAIEQFKSLGDRLKSINDGRFELGFAYYSSGQLSEAEEKFAQLLKAHPGHLRAHYYQALVLMEQNKFRQARDVLAPILNQESELQEQAMFLSVVINYRLGELENTERQANSLLKRYPDSLYSKRVDDIIGRVRALKEGHKGTRIEMNVGLSYDSNVGLYSDTELVTLGNAEDYRLHVSVDAGVELTRGSYGELSGGYSLFASRHGELSEYDIMSHQPYLELRGTHNDYTYLVNYAYSATSLDGSDYLRAQQITPTLFMGHDALRYSMLSLSWILQDYQSSALLEQRDGSLFQIRYRHFWNQDQSGEYYYYAGAELGVDNASGSEYRYSAQSVTAGVQYPWRAYRLGGVITVGRRDYSDSLLGRMDNEHEMTFFGEYPLGEQQSLNLSLAWMGSDSNDPLYDYTRTVLSLGYGRIW